MSHPLLIQLAHDSILEVLQSKNSIDKESLLKEYPLLEEMVPMTLKIFLNNELRGYYENMAHLCVVDAIIIGAKKAAFEDKNFEPLTLSEYFEIEIEIALQTAEGVISHRA